MQIFKQSIRFSNKSGLIKMGIIKPNLIQMRNIYSYANQENIKKISQELKSIKSDIEKLYEKPDYVSFGLVKPEIKEIKKRVSELKKLVKPDHDVLSHYHHIE